MAPAHAVVPIAGLATRLLPLTKALPKAMLPLGDRTVLDHVLAELAGAGVQRVTIVASPRDCVAVTSYLARDAELENLLRGRGRPDLAESISRIGEKLEIGVVAQPAPLGLGDALLCAREEIAGEPFVLALGDALLHRADGSPSLITARLAEVLDTRGAVCAIAVTEVAPDRVSDYGIVSLAGPRDDGVADVAAIVEKPMSDEAPSRLAVAARYACGPGLVDALDACRREGAGELGLTPGLQRLLDDGERVVAVQLHHDERRRDVGTLAGWRGAMLDELLRDPSLRQLARERVDG